MLPLMLGVLNKSSGYRALSYYFPGWVGYGNLRRRLQMGLDADGGHIGNAFNVIFNLPRLLKSDTPNTAMVAM